MASIQAVRSNSATRYRGMHPTAWAAKHHEKVDRKTNTRDFAKQFEDDRELAMGNGAARSLILDDLIDDT